MKNRFLLCLFSLATTAIFVGVLTSPTALKAQSKGAITVTSPPAHPIPGTAPSGPPPTSLPHGAGQITTPAPGDSWNCSPSVEKYSEDKWQYAKFSLCIKFENWEINTEVVASEIQYYWGAAWYYGTKARLYAVHKTYLDGDMVIENDLRQDTTSGHMVAAIKNYEVFKPGNYTVSNGKVELRGIWYDNSPIFLDLPTVELEVRPSDIYRAALGQIEDAIAANPKDVTVYLFGDKNRVPWKISEGAFNTLYQDARLIVIPDAFHLNKANPRLVSHLLPDTHLDNNTVPITDPAWDENKADERCENNPFAWTDNSAEKPTKQASELRTPAQAWLALGKPAIALNANYFDVRAQKAGTLDDWKNTKCSAPLGMYFDNHTNWETKNKQITDSKYYAGPKEFINNKGDQTAPLQTFFIAEGSATNLDHNDFTIVEEMSSAEAFAEHIVNNFDIIPFSAFSGTQLLPELSVPEPSPDSGPSKTTRIAIGFSPTKNRFYILEGGTYRNGIDRDDLRNILFAVGADKAMELDGGGSAAFVVDKSKVKWAGAWANRPDLQEGSCAAASNDQAYCTPITQPDGAPRPVPGWLALDLVSQQ